MSERDERAKYRLLDAIIPMNYTLLLFLFVYFLIWWWFGGWLLLWLHLLMALATGPFAFYQSGEASSSYIDSLKISCFFVLVALVIPHWTVFGYLLWNWEPWQRAMTYLHKTLFRRHDDVNYYRY
jgi:membrane protein YdbS with pleckstrin-like domain